MTANARRNEKLRHAERDRRRRASRSTRFGQEPRPTHQDATRPALAYDGPVAAQEVYQ